MSGIRVIRVWSYITANEGFVKRILDYQSFMVTATLAALFVRRVDVVLGTSPQFFTVCAAYVVSVLKRIPFVFELRDLWPESIKAVGAMKESAAIRALERLGVVSLSRAARIVSVTHSFKKTLIARGVDGEKVAVVTNGVDMSRFKPMPKDATLLRELGLEGKFVAGYVGTHGLAHHLETVLDAAEILRKAPDGAAVPLHFAGRWRPQAGAQRRRGAARPGQCHLCRFGAQGAGGALLVVARCRGDTPAENRACSRR
jgi:glycosyltransferase involved in cell wall biosynthesis